MTDAFGASRIQARAPERGVFPLDHDGECKEPMKLFLACLKEHSSDHFPCKQLSKNYLQCRMDRNLMAKEEFDKLGFGKDGENTTYKRRDNDEGIKETAGFVAGLGVRGSNKSWWSNNDKM